MTEKAAALSRMASQISLHPEELRCINSILQRIIPDREVWVFGSRTTTHHKPYSDLDMVVMGDNALSLEKFADLQIAFSESDLTFKVDIVLWSELSDNFKRIIQNQYMVIRSALGD